MSSSILAVSPIRSSKMLSAICIFIWASIDAVPFSTEHMNCTRPRSSVKSGAFYAADMLLLLIT